MRNNILIMMSLLFILVPVTVSFSLTDQKQYDPNAYASSLMQTQK